MRSLLTLGALIAAMLVPWTPVAPTWLPDAAGSSVVSEPSRRQRGPAARLDPALGILPLTADSVAADSAGSLGDASEPPADPELFGDAGMQGPGRRVVCEGGVCRLVDEETGQAAEPGDAATRTPLLDRLRTLGAVQVRVERDQLDTETRASCMVPVSAGSRVIRRFDAIGDRDPAALRALIEQIESWLAEPRD